MAKEKKAKIKGKVDSKLKGRVVEENITSFGKRALKLYADEVNLERATPDLIDGLKPVSRRIVFGTSEVAKTQFAKSAQIVGHVMGTYHPHGDSSIYGAMVTMVNATTPLLHGKGGWGTLLDNAAAMRYTNARLSAFGRIAFDSDYMNKEVTTFVPNYDDRTTEPVSIPFPLPVILFSGDSGIGYGSACDIPGFTPESVVEVLKKLLQGEKLKPIDFAKIMKPEYKWGGEFVNTKVNREAWLQMFKTSKASVQFQAPLHLDQAKRQVMINEWPYGLDPEKFVAWAREQPEVLQVYPSKGTTEFTIVMKKGYNSVQWDAFIKKVQKRTQVKSSYNINVTKRTATITDGVVDYDVKMMSLSVPQLVIAWLRARLEIETKALTYRIKRQNEAIAYSKLMIFAATKLDVIVPIIRKSKAPREELMKKLKLTKEQADQILELKLRQLTRLDQDAIDAKRKEQVKHLEQLEKWLAKPKKKLVLDIDAAMEAIVQDRKFVASKDKQELTLEA